MLRYNNKACTAVDLAEKQPGKNPLMILSGLGMK